MVFAYAILVKMRLKLILLTSFMGALLGCGVPVLLIALTQGRRGFLLAKSFPASNELSSAAIFLIPFTAALCAGFFIYRHTARRRKFQTVLTALLVLLFSALGFVAVTLSLNFM